MRKPQGRFFQMSIAASNARHRIMRFGLLWAVGFTTVLLAGCGELEPMREPEVVDLQLTTDTLRTSVRDAQRVAAELRIDLEARRRDLSEAQVARAQLEGRVREAERRVIEARQVIELQREELAAARIERGRVSRSSIQSQNQMKQLHKQLSETERSGLDQNGQESVLRPSSHMPRKGQKAMQVPAHRSQPSEYQETQSTAVPPATMAHMPIIRESSAVSERQRAPTRHVSVKPGDTLWSIAQKYHVNMELLRTLNQVTDNKIITGQALWLPDDSSLLGGGADMVSSMP